MKRIGCHAKKNHPGSFTFGLTDAGGAYSALRPIAMDGRHHVELCGLGKRRRLFLIFRRIPADAITTGALRGRRLSPFDRA